MPTDLDAYFQQHAQRPPPYRGQLTAEFQAALQARFSGVGAEDCAFYHTTELPDGRVFEAEWDLRGQEALFLGRQDLAGKRVIEYGPASGALSAYMAKHGAELTVFDLPFGRSPDIMPFPDLDGEASRRSGAEAMGRLRNSWWFARRELGFDARAVYADIYDQPDDLGEYDVAVFSMILLHLSNPFRALQMAAARTRGTMVLTELMDAPPGVRDLWMELAAYPVAVFGPSSPPVGVVHWWTLTPAVLRHMLWRLGFTDISTVPHPGKKHITVVGKRP